MHYVKKTAEGICIKDESGTRTLKKGFVQYINERLIEQLSTFDGRMRAVKTLTQRMRHVPIVIDEGCCLYLTESLRSPHAIGINIHAVLSIRRDMHGCAEVWFKDLTVLKTACDYEALTQKHARTAVFLRTLARAMQESVFTKTARMDFIGDV